MKNSFYEGAVPFISETAPTPSPLKAVRLKIGFQREMGSFFTIGPRKKTGPARAEFNHRYRFFNFISSRLISRIARIKLFCTM